MDGGRAGEGAWIEDVLARYEGPLVRYAWRITGDLESARDVVQDTFLRLCQADRSRLEGGLGAWLYTVCRNRALDAVRKDRKMDALDDAGAAVMASPEPGPSAAAELSAAHGEVLRVLATLPASQQEVVRLRFHAGLSYKEISTVTGHSVTNVGYLIHAAVKSLREQMDGAGGLTAPQRSAS
jgi:RNA polymerase sigma factor (sigma-70 family)